MKDLPEAVNLYKEPALPQKVEKSPVTPTEVINGKTIPLTSHEEVVLLVEDNQDLQNFITEILTVRYNVITPNDGLQDERRAFEHIPDLVISSVMMPKKRIRAP